MLLLTPSEMINNGNRMLLPALLIFYPRPLFTTLKTNFPAKSKTRKVLVYSDAEFTGCNAVKKKRETEERKKLQEEFTHRPLIRKSSSSVTEYRFFHRKHQ